jgi:penicillin-binding protein 1A
MAVQYVPPTVKRKKRRSLALRFLGFAFAAGVVGLLGVAAAIGFVFWQYSKDLPDFEVLRHYEPPVMTRVHAGDGSLIAEYAREKRIFVPISNMPKRLVQAFMSAEDKNFYEHNGLDYMGIGRSLINYVVFRKRLIGASTITQQVAKNFLLTNERSMARKVKEAILALRIESAYTKEQILELYLNEIYLGEGSYGVAAASLNYFGKELHELTVAEVGYLAALPKAPNNYNPFKHAERAIDRRNWVVGQMQENGFISKQELDQTLAQKDLGINMHPVSPHIFAAEFFAEDVRRELVDMFGEEKALSGGLSVRTTLDPTYQRLAKKALVDGMVRYDRSKGWRGAVNKIDVAAEADWGVVLGQIDVWSDIDPWRLAVVLEVTPEGATVGLQPARAGSGKVSEKRDQVVLAAEGAKWAVKKGKGVESLLQPGDVIYVAPSPTGEDQWQLMQIPEVGGAIVVMDPHTGRVLSLVGGFSFSASQFDRVTQARRQPGSAFKPFVYATALDNGYTPASVILDAPIEIEQGPGLDIWKPENYKGKYYGPSTLRTGIEYSRNLMTVRLAQDVGMPLIADYAKRFGVYDNLLPVLSTALGSGETSLLKVATGYCVLANGGHKVTATLIDRIQDRTGKTVMRHDKRLCDGCEAAKWEGQDEPDFRADETDPDTRQVIDPHTAYQITSMMEGVVQRGTGTALKAVGKPIAGKTGTTNQAKDAWFVGYTPDLVVGVFVGYDSPKPMGDQTTGGLVAAPIARDFLIEALKDKPAVPFRIPPGIKLVRIDRHTGASATADNPESIVEAFKPDTAPSESGSLAQGDVGGGTDQGASLANDTGGLY